MLIGSDPYRLNRTERISTSSIFNRSSNYYATTKHVGNLTQNYSSRFPENYVQYSTKFTTSPHSTTVLHSLTGIDNLNGLQRYLVIYALLICVGVLLALVAWLVLQRRSSLRCSNVQRPLPEPLMMFYYTRANHSAPLPNRPAPRPFAELPPVANYYSYEGLYQFANDPSTISSAQAALLERSAFDRPQLDFIDAVHYSSLLSDVLDSSTPSQQRQREAFAAYANHAPAPGASAAADPRRPLNIDYGAARQPSNASVPEDPGSYVSYLSYLVSPFFEFEEISL